MKRLVLFAAAAAACLFAAACSPAYAATPPAFDDPVAATSWARPTDDLLTADLAPASIEIRATAREVASPGAQAGESIEFPIDYSAIRSAVFYGPIDRITGHVVTPAGRTPRYLTG